MRVGRKEEIFRSVLLRFAAISVSEVPITWNFMLPIRPACVRREIGFGHGVYGYQELDIIEIVERTVRGCPVIPDNHCIVETLKHAGARPPGFPDAEEAFIARVDAPYCVHRLVVIASGFI